MKKSLLTFATLALAALSLSGCQTAEPVRPVKAFSLGETMKNESGFDLYKAHRINLLDKGVYEYVQTQITYGYSMNLGTTVITTYGTYTENGAEDGVTSYTLSQAGEVVLSSYSKAGGFKIQVNTASEKQTYPAELPAKKQGEKIEANSKEDVIKAYGEGAKIFVGSDSVISFKDPNSGEATPVTTPSGDVSSALKKFKQVQVSSDIKGSGMVNYTVDYVHIYEDNSYEYINTNITYGYSMVLGTSTLVKYGQGEYGTSSDGYTPYTLKQSDDVSLNSYSKAGGFSIVINTASKDQTYPTELPASGEGEKVYAQNKEDVINAYGKEFKVYTSDSDCEMSLNDPNA